MPNNHAQQRQQVNSCQDSCQDGIEKEAWIRRHDSFAWLLIGLGWWMAGLAGAIGLGLATAMATVLLLRSRSNRRRTLAGSEG